MEALSLSWQLDKVDAGDLAHYTLGLCLVK